MPPRVYGDLRDERSDTVKTVVSFVPQDVSSILVAATGDGRIGAALRTRAASSGTPISLTGLTIDPDHDPAATPEGFDQVYAWHGSTSAQHPYAGRTYGAAVVDDFLEHLTDPWTALRSVVQLVEPGGTVVVSMENAANLMKFARAVEGEWGAGHDGEHGRHGIRSLTRRGLTELAVGAGVDVTETARVFDTDFPVKWETRNVLAARTIQAGRLFVRAIHASGMADLSTSTFVMAGVRSPTGAAARESARSEFSVIVVTGEDADSSTDRVAASLQRDTHPVAYEIIDVDAGANPIRALNDGAGRAHGAILCFVDPMCELSPSALAWVREVMGNVPQVGAVGMRIETPSGELWSAGYDVSPDGDGLAVVARSRIMPPDDPALSTLTTVMAAPVEALAVRRSAFDQVGGFDEGFRFGLHDVDLCLNLVQRGWWVMNEPRSVVLYHGDRSQLPETVNPAALARLKVRAGNRLDSGPYSQPQPDEI